MSSLTPLPSLIGTVRRPRAPVSVRSVLLGVIGVAFICLLTPYNDYVVNNTYLVGNFLPIGLLLFFVTFIMAVNGPLLRWAPSRAFTSGELSVAFAMTLVSCGIPSSGLMRFLPGQLIGFWYQASGNGDFRSLLRDLSLPAWIFPKLSTTDPLRWATDPVIGDYFGRASVHENTFADHWRAVPWRAWLTPTLSWGVLLIFVYGAIVCLCILVRRQWTDNERLTFPLATIYLSMIESPEKGRFLNPLFGSRLFWIATVTVFIIHGSNGLHEYAPRYCPEISVRYNLTSMFADTPWTFADRGIKSVTLYFCVVGVAYFLQSNVALGLFATYLLMQVGVKMGYGVAGTELTDGMGLDLMFGSIVPFAISILWLGRSHWMLILQQMLRGARPGEPAEHYLSYRLTGWLFVVCLAGIATWLMLVGASVVGAIVLVLMLLLPLIVVMRIVAETGLIFVQLPIPLTRPWVYLANGLLHSPSVRTTLRSYFLTSWFDTLFTRDMREAMPVFASHALRVTDAELDATPRRWQGVAILGCLALAMLLGYVCSGTSMLYCEYTHSITLDAVPETPVNSYGVYTVPKTILQSGVDYKPPGTGPREGHNRLAYFSAGAIITVLLVVLRLRFMAWPLHPVGFMLAMTYPMRCIWFSIMIGWMLKTLIVRFGGAELFKRARPLFVGMIVGESVAAAFWMVVSLILASAGQPYHAIRVLPT